MRSLPRHVDDIEKDNRIIYNKIIGFKEAQIKPSDSVCNTKEAYNLFNISFNNN